MSKKIIIIAGPNGAGKTTFARSFLPLEVLKSVQNFPGSWGKER